MGEVDIRRGFANNTRRLWDEFCEAWSRLRRQPSVEDFTQWCWEAYGRRIGRNV